MLSVTGACDDRRVTTAPTSEPPGSKLDRWTSATEWPLMVAALGFLAATVFNDFVSDLLGGLTGGEVLVRLGELSERGQRVGSELVEDTGDELGELLVLTDTVDGEGVGGYRGVNCRVAIST